MFLQDQLRRFRLRRSPERQTAVAGRRRRSKRNLLHARAIPGPEMLEARMLLATTPILSEFMADNESTLVDQFGDSSDWIEIYNPTSQLAELDGWYLTDDRDALTKWQFPAVSLAPGDFLVVFASGNDLADPAAELHTSFQLDSHGEYLALVQPDGRTVASEFGRQYPDQFADVSYGVELQVASTQLIDIDNQARVLVPDATIDSQIGDAWTGGSEPFDDASAWSPGGQAIGFAPDVGAVSNYESEVLADAPLVYYRFEETNISSPAADASGNGRQGVYEGAVGLGGASMGPRLGLAAEFKNGAPNTAVSIPALGARQQVTVETWVKLDSLTTFDTVFNVDGWSTGYIHYQFLNNGLLRFSVNSGGPNDRDLGPLGGFQPNTWYHIVTTYDSTQSSNNAEMFVNGASVGSTTFSNRQTAVLNSAHLGAWNGNDRQFDGLIDEFAIYDSILSDERIAEHFNSASGPTRHVFSEYIETDWEAAMLGVNASTYVRIPFDNTADHAVETLALQVQYDAGFVAYLNGQEVAHANAPGRDGEAGTLTWDAAAPHQRQDKDAIEFQSFDITAFRDLLQPTGNILAIQALNESAADDGFLLAAKLRASGPVTVGQPRFFGIPTPGSLNDPRLGAPTSPVEFSRTGGTFSAPISVELTTESAGARIYYTLNGDAPNGASNEYTGPIAVSTSTQLRAVALEQGRLPGPTRTESYLQLSGDLQSFSSNLPIVVLENFGGGDPNQSTMINFNLTIFEPDAASGRSRLTDDADVSIRSGIKIRGNSSAGFPKKQFRLEVRDEADGDREMALLGLPADSDWVLGAPYTDKTLFRNSFSFELGREIGLDAPRTRHIEVYLNQNGGPLSAADYVGVYELKEAIVIGQNRVDVQRLDGGDTSEPEIAGGYLLRNEDTVTTAPLAGWGGLELVNPEEYTDLQKQWITAYMNDFRAALNGPNFADPQNGYAKFVDIDAWVNLVMINELTRDQDSYVRSNYLYKDRDGLLVQGPLWDFNLIMGTGCCFDNRNPLGWQTDQNYNRVGHLGTDPGWIQRMLDDPDFTQLVIDRWAELRDGPFHLDSLFARIDAYAEELSEAQVRNFQRWNILTNPNPGFPSPVTNTWQEQIDFVKDWLTTRTNWLDSRFVQRPSLDRPSGLVNRGETVGFEAVSAGAIYYTTDGTDPRGPGGAIAGQLYNGTPLAIDESTVIVARLFNSNAPAAGAEVNQTDWSAPIVGSYLLTTPASAGNLAITELNYNPHDPTADELAALPGVVNDDFEYVELQNVAEEAIDLNSVRFSDGITFNFTGGAVTVLQPRERVLVVGNQTAFEIRYGGSHAVAGVYEGNLRNSGERLELVDFQSQIIRAFSYGDSGSWPGRADGGGSALEIIDVGGNYDDSANWRPSAEYGGSPGAAGIAPFADVVVNEVLSHTDPPQLDAIELYNTSDAAKDVGGWYLSDTSDNYRKFQIPAGTMIPAGGYLVFDESNFNASAGADPNDFAFSGARGDDVWLMEASGSGELRRFADHGELLAAANGESFGRWPNASGQLYPMASLTLGQANSAPRVGPLVITEVNFDPVDLTSELINPAQFEFVEVLNPTPAAVDLTNWQLTGGVDFEFPAGTIIESSQLLVVVSFDPFDPDSAALRDEFRAFHGIDENIALVGGFSGRLDNAGERVRLRRPDQPPLDEPDLIPLLLEDEVNYGDREPWPTVIGAGASLNRIDAAAWGNDPQNWIAATPTPGSLSTQAAVVVAFQINQELADPPDLTSGAAPSHWTRQRSDLRSITVSFSRQMNIDASDIILTHLGVDAPVDPDTVITVDNASLRIEGIQLIVHFDAENLPFGVYQLEILDTATDVFGAALDGDGDGASGGRYLLRGDAANRFFKQSSDFNGDGGATIFDFPTFAYWFGQSLPTAPEYVDLNRDGGVTIFDFPVFAAAFGKSVTFPQPLQPSAAIFGAQPELPSNSPSRSGRQSASQQSAERKDAVGLMRANASRQHSTVKRDRIARQILERPGGLVVRDAPADNVALDAQALEVIVEQIAGEIARQRRG